MFCIDKHSTFSQLSERKHEPSYDGTDREPDNPELQALETHGPVISSLRKMLTDEDEHIFEGLEEEEELINLPDFDESDFEEPERSESEE